MFGGQLPGLRRQRHPKLRSEDLVPEIRQGFELLLSRGLYAVSFVDKVSRRNRMDPCVMCVTTEYTFLCTPEAKIGRVYRNRDIEQLLLQRRSDGWLAALSPRAHSGDPCLLLALRRDPRSRPSDDPLEAFRILQWVRSPFCKDVMGIRELPQDPRPLSQLGRNEPIRSDWGANAFAKPPGYMDQQWLQEKLLRWGQGGEVRHDITLQHPSDQIGISFGKHPYREGRIVITGVTAESAATKALPEPVPVGAVLVSVDAIEVNSEESLQFAVAALRSERKTRFCLMREEKLLRGVARGDGPSAFEDAEPATRAGDPEQSADPVLFDTADGDEVRYEAATVEVGGAKMPALAGYLNGAYQSSATTLKWDEATGKLCDQAGIGGILPVEGRLDLLQRFVALADAVGVPHNISDELARAEEQGKERELDAKVNARVEAEVAQRRAVIEHRAAQQLELERQVLRQRSESVDRDHAVRMAQLQGIEEGMQRWWQREEREQTQLLEAERRRLDAARRAGAELQSAEQEAEKLRQQAAALAAYEEELRRREEEAEAARMTITGATAELPLSALRQSPVPPEKPLGAASSESEARRPLAALPSEPPTPPVPASPAPHTKQQQLRRGSEPVRLWLPPPAENAVFAGAGREPPPVPVGTFRRL
eukprot:TRINITY_DN3895_c0_g1_i1.p1 TRINITY_DN3895_c0_g1~~TRINITY_DN3895_c0_g1_i1.p1  ORF type:complete len:652 (+),score=204.97 TRINITY_DN3895_c0_g1_i1:73-2028(+)